MGGGFILVFTGRETVLILILFIIAFICGYLTAKKDYSKVFKGDLDND